MDYRQRAESALNKVTILNDNGFTFVNYGNDGNFTYRQEARVHNAHRRARDTLKPSRASERQVKESRDNPAAARRHPKPSSNSTSFLLPKTDLVVTRMTQTNIVASPTRPLEPPLVFEGLSLHHSLNMRKQILEHQWRSVFQYHFYLPQVDNVFGLQSPQSAFLAAADTDMHTYRNLVIQPVVSSAVKTGQQSSEAVFRNQALILQDFRQLAEMYTNSESRLTREQFQRFFATTFAFHAHDFHKATAYDAIMYANSILVTVPRNQGLRQLPTVEWIRTLMPLPRSSFHQSCGYRAQMLRKIKMILDFLEKTREQTYHHCRDSLRHHFDHETALYHIIRTSIPDVSGAEPYHGFHSVCLHRILFLLHAYLNHDQRTSDQNPNHFLSRLESIASFCVVKEFPHNITLFLWYLLVILDEQEQGWDQHEPFFSWAIREIISSHNLSFIPVLRALLLRRVGWEDLPIDADADFDELRNRMQLFYQLDSE
ncbi:hypothetical protein H2198_002861 [Neophaeococcomyces mojaviensis]|uniref:Uncharacterized protein n=1 Tax=Neophaeococcomyces mojaviensis TaxID=3383035 RepID=A0ACC3AD31_9EURO|nr:hypothetical protein H2198_002861 [Knufia sp. JES_112]